MAIKAFNNFLIPCIRETIECQFHTHLTFRTGREVTLPHGTNLPNTLEPWRIKVPSMNNEFQIKYKTPGGLISQSIKVNFTYLVEQTSRSQLTVLPLSSDVRIIMNNSAERWRIANCTMHFLHNPELAPVRRSFVAEYYEFLALSLATGRYTSPQLD